MLTTLVRRKTKNMIKLFRYLSWKDIIAIFLCFGLVTLSVYLELLIPDYMGDMSTQLLATEIDMGSILVSGGYMLLCAISTCLVMVLVYFLSAQVGSRFSKSLREALYSKVQRLSEKDIEAFSTASLITRTTNDVTQITILLTMGMSLVFKAPVMAIWAIIKILGKGNDSWTIAVGVAVAILIVAIAIIGSLALPKLKLVQSKVDKVNAMSRENIQGLRVIKAFNAESYQGGKFEKANHDLTKTNTFTGVVMGFASPLITAIMSGLPLAIYYLGALSISQMTNRVEQITTFSNMMVFSSYSAQVIMGFLMLIMVFLFSPRSFVSAKRVSEVLYAKESLVEGTFAGETEEQGTIVFDHVSFGYDNPDKTDHENVIKDISLSIKKGETFAIIGPTGSGKSTLVGLLMRYYDPSEGKILLDGVNLPEYKFRNLYGKIALVPQKATLFSGSIKENIAYGESNGYSDEDIAKALRISHSEEFISKKDAGIDSKIEQGGKNVSGGQKQRLSIARALARDPEILILDDSLSALDFKTDFEVRKALNEEYKGVTKIIVAQRIGSIKEADQILVLDNGAIAGLGKHEELLKSCPLYQEIAQSQLSKEELE